jgi:hypothetical protein
MSTQLDVNISIVFQKWQNQSRDMEDPFPGKASLSNRHVSVWMTQGFNYYLYFGLVVPDWKGLNCIIITAIF